jgi:hypothetical protein
MHGADVKLSSPYFEQLSSEIAEIKEKFVNELYKVIMNLGSFIHSVALLQVHNLFQSEFPKKCDLVLPLSVLNTSLLRNVIQ